VEEELETFVLFIVLSVDYIEPAHILEILIELRSF
jgi:hypothetical protein